MLCMDIRKILSIDEVCPRELLNRRTLSKNYKCYQLTIYLWPDKKTIQGALYDEIDADAPFISIVVVDHFRLTYKTTTTFLTHTYIRQH